MGVAFVAALHFAEVRLIRGVHVHVLLAIGAVGKAAVASFKLTFERFFTFKNREHRNLANKLQYICNSTKITTNI